MKSEIIYSSDNFTTTNILKKSKTYGLNAPCYPSGETPYTCDVCSAAFSELKNLKDHLRIHSGEKPYTSDVCLAQAT